LKRWALRRWRISCAALAVPGWAGSGGWSGKFGALASVSRIAVRRLAAAAWSITGQR
jgi:hypothetical protein